MDVDFTLSPEVWNPGATFHQDPEADIPGMALKSQGFNATVRIALAIWCVLLPVLPGPSLAEELSGAESDSCCSCSGCGEVDLTPRCAREAPVPCTAGNSGNSCNRCPLASGSLVFIAPDGVSLQRFDLLAWLLQDDFSPQEALYAPPDPPPQSADIS